MENEEKIIFQNEAAGIYTKDFFFVTGKILLQLAKRNQVPLLVAVVDIDDFEALTSEFGNATGEKLLELTTKLIEDHCRTSDLVAFMGKGQIGLIFYNITNVDAKNTLEVLREKVAKNTYLINNEERYMTVSIGGSIMQSRINAGAIEMVYEQACMAVETAQRKGKNCVVVY